MKQPVRYPDLRLRAVAEQMTLSMIVGTGDGSASGHMAHEPLQMLGRKGDGLALAANQAGQTWRYFVVSRERADRDVEGKLVPTVVCNPVIREASPEMVEDVEGCLSFPGLFFKVKRHAWVVAAFDVVRDGQLVTEELRLTGLWARVFQHEIEHLDGKTFVDNLPQKKRMQIANGLRLRMQKAGW